MTISEYIRILVDNVFDDNLNYRFTIRGLSDEILKMTGEYFSYTQIYEALQPLIMTIITIHEM